MYCPYCGKDSYSNSYCYECGYTALPMKYYKFLIYFLLIFQAVINFISGTILLVFPFTGMADNIYGVFTIGMGVFIIIARNKLRNYDESAPGFYIGLNVIALVIDCLFHLFGYDLGFDGLGFFMYLLVTIGIIIAEAVYLNKRSSLFSDSQPVMYSPAPTPLEAGPDTWKCKCGKVHPSYVGTCGCGYTKKEYDSKTKAVVTPKASSPDYSEELRNLKKLLDEEIITQEEFETKKKQLLKL